MYILGAVFIAAGFVLYVLSLFIVKVKTSVKPEQLGEENEHTEDFRGIFKVIKNILETISLLGIVSGIIIVAVSVLWKI